MLFSLGVGNRGVFNESEVVGDALVVGEPPMGPNQAVLTNRHLERRVKPCLKHDCKRCRHIALSGISAEPKYQHNPSESRPHHSIRAPLRYEGMGLILWHHNFNQWNSVTDALQNHIIITVFKKQKGKDNLIELDKPLQRKIWVHRGVQTCWEHMSPAGLSFSLLPPESVSLDEVPVQQKPIYQQIHPLVKTGFKLDKPEYVSLP